MPKTRRARGCRRATRAAQSEEGLHPDYVAPAPPGSNFPHDKYGLVMDALRESLGGVDKFEPVSGGGKLDHAKQAVGQLVVPCGNGAVDLEPT